MSSADAMPSPPSPPTPSVPTSPDGAAAAPKTRRELSCIGKSILALIDGGTFGAAIGGIFASANAIGSITGGTESIVGAARTVFRASAASAMSLGLALGAYTGGVCSMERWRGKKDVVNPFVIGGIGGAIGAIQRVEAHDGQHRRTVLAFSGRGLMAGSLSSAMLCSVFWYMQQPSRAAREEREKQAIAQAEAQQQQQKQLEQQRMQQRQRLAADPETQKLMAALQAGTIDKEEASRRLKLVAARQTSAAAAAKATAAAAPPTSPETLIGGDAPPSAGGANTADGYGGTDAYGGGGGAVAAPPEWDPLGTAGSSSSSSSSTTPELTLTDGLALPDATPGFVEPVEPALSPEPGFANDPSGSGAGGGTGGGFSGDGFKDPWAGK